MRLTSIMPMLILLILAMLLVPGSAVHAQEPTPTPTVTPTPAYLSEVPLSSGDTVVIQRSVTYGDIAIVICLVVLLVGEVMQFLVNWSQKWLK